MESTEELSNQDTLGKLAVIFNNSGNWANLDCLSRGCMSQAESIIKLWINSKL